MSEIENQIKETSPFHSPSLEEIKEEFKSLRDKEFEPTGILPLNELSDDLLLKIFLFTLGPLEHKQYYVNNASIPFGIRLRYEHLEPTQLQNFEELIILTQVCTRWNRLINSPVLWRIVNVRPKQLQIPRDPSSWQSFFQILAPRAKYIETLCMTDEEALRDDSLDQLKIGALSVLAYNIKTLHLDRCFHPSMGAQLASMLSGIQSLVQLQVTNVNHEFVSKMTCLHRLQNLKRIQIQGCEDYWDHAGPMLMLDYKSLPQNIQVISLSNIKIMSPTIPSNFPNLQTLHLVFIEWYGGFIKCITAIKTLKKLIVQDCDRAIEDEDDYEAIETLVAEEREYWKDLDKLKSIEWLELSNSQYGDFTERLGKDMTCISLLTNLRKLRICPDEIASVTHPNLGDGLSLLTSLTQLHLVNFGFREVLPEVWSLPCLKELSLAGNNLSDIPWDPPAFTNTLQRVFLDTNSFDELPESLMLWTTLEELSLSQNSFRFTVPLDFLTTMPNLKRIVFGPGKGAEVFPTGGPLMVERLCDEMKLNTIGIFHLGGLCGNIKLKGIPLKIFM